MHSYTDMSVKPKEMGTFPNLGHLFWMQIVNSLLKILHNVLFKIHISITIEQAIWTHKSHYKSKELVPTLKQHSLFCVGQWKPSGLIYVFPIQLRETNISITFFVSLSVSLSLYLSVRPFPRLSNCLFSCNKPAPIGRD